MLGHLGICPPVLHRHTPGLQWTGRGSGPSGLCALFCQAPEGDHLILPALKSQPSFATLDLGGPVWELWLLNKRRN